MLIPHGNFPYPRGETPVNYRSIPLYSTGVGWGGAIDRRISVSVGCCYNIPARSGVLSVHYQGCNSTQMYKGGGGWGPPMDDVIVHAHNDYLVAVACMLSDLKTEFLSGFYHFQ